MKRPTQPITPPTQPYAPSSLARQSDGNSTTHITMAIAGKCLIALCTFYGNSNVKGVVKLPEA